MSASTAMPITTHTAIRSRRFARGESFSQNFFPATGLPLSDRFEDKRRDRRVARPVAEIGDDDGVPFGVDARKVL